MKLTKGQLDFDHPEVFWVTIIVTSRPAAFAKSVIFPPDVWKYYELVPLKDKQISEYTGKWCKAKGLSRQDSEKIREILERKLQEPHTKFLAQNPMQLTILLSLMNIRGSSLPDKRTSLYDSYMDLFFSRESEKSEIVLEYRDLLFDIHRYIAWKLQTAAEAGEGGSIERSSLRAICLPISISKVSPHPLLTHCSMELLSASGR